MEPLLRLREAMLQCTSYYYCFQCFCVALQWIRLSIYGRYTKIFPLLWALRYDAQCRRNINEWMALQAQCFDWSGQANVACQLNFAKDNQSAHLWSSRVGHSVDSKSICVSNKDNLWVQLNRRCTKDMNFIFNLKCLRASKSKITQEQKWRFCTNYSLQETSPLRCSLALMIAPISSTW